LAEEIRVTGAIEGQATHGPSEKFVHVVEEELRTILFAGSSE
jgi:hypothetical protein